MSEWSRRRFLSSVGVSLAAPGAFLTTAQAVPTARAVSEQASAAGGGRWSNLVIVNALGGLEDPNPRPGKVTPTQANPTAAGDDNSTSDERILIEAHASGLTAVNITLGYVAGDMEPFEATIRDIARTDAHIRTRPGDLLKVHGCADILRAKAEGKIGLIYGFQNAAMVGQDAARIDIFAGLGVRVIQLTYNPANQVGDGSAEPRNRGLTPLGHEVVERLNANRVMVDLSHSGEHTCLEAARVSKQPVSINHTGCRALVDLPRNKTDEELRLVASKGGFVGIYFMPFLSRSGHVTAADVVAHIDHAVNVCGEEHVGIGTDGSVTTIDDLEAYKAALAKEVEARRQAGISAAGERPDTLPFTIDLRGVNQFRELADRLEQRGYSRTRIERILGRNFMRYASDVWGACNTSGA